jgi:hypothetical protein
MLRSISMTTTDADDIIAALADYLLWSWIKQYPHAWRIVVARLCDEYGFAHVNAALRICVRDAKRMHRQGRQAKAAYLKRGSEGLMMAGPTQSCSGIWDTPA